VDGDLVRFFPRMIVARVVPAVMLRGGRFFAAGSIASQSMVLPLEAWRLQRNCAIPGGILLHR